VSAARRGLRIGLAGATGALGREVLAVLDESEFPAVEVLPFATERSVGQEVEFCGEPIAVESELPALRGLDLVIVCTPPGAALELVRECLRAEVACIDCSGALAASSEVPLLAAGLSPASAAIGAPVVSSPPGCTLSWFFALSALDRAAGLRRVVGTAIQSASLAGRPGIEALSSETVALLNQRTPPELGVFAGQVAFDCVPRDARGAAGPDAVTASESALIGMLARLLAATAGERTGSAPTFAVTTVQVPTFIGDGSVLAVETLRPLSPEEAEGVLEKAPGLRLWTQGGIGPTTRDAAGCEDAIVGRVRRDPSVECGLLLWLAADSLRLAAHNVVKLAESRLRLH